LNKGWTYNRTEELIKIIDNINPENEPGKVTLICRMGADKIDNHLPSIIQKVKNEGKIVVWACDPMHGNTIKSKTGYKTRPVNNIFSEIQKFFTIHKASGTYPGGIHLEMTGSDVTECMGGLQQITDEDLKNRYHTFCDPRLNASQSLEIAFLISEYLKDDKFLTLKSSQI